MKFSEEKKPEKKDIFYINNKLYKASKLYKWISYTILCKSFKIIPVLKIFIYLILLFDPNRANKKTTKMQFICIFVVVVYLV